MNENVVNDTQAPVVAEQDAGASISEQAQSAEVAAPPEAEDAKKAQTRGENAQFARLRRKFEKELKEKTDALARQNEYAKKAGYDTVEEMLEHIAADKLGISVEEYRAQMRSDEQKRREAVLGSPEYGELKDKLEALQGERIQSQMSEDLKNIQKVYPSVKDLDELGEVYQILLANGTDPLTAAHAAMAARPSPPKAIGAIGEQTGVKDAYYTEDEIEYYNAHPGEVKKMSKTNFEKLIKSISRKG